jgi:hypothetical protein
MDRLASHGRIIAERIKMLLRNIRNNDRSGTATQ